MLHNGSGLMSDKSTLKLFSFNALLPLRYDICGQLVSSHGFLHHRRCFEYHVLIFVTEGTLYVTTDGVPYTVSAGQYILFRAGTEHFGHKESTGRLSYMWVHFSTDSDPDTNIDNEDMKCVFPEYSSFSVSGRVSLLFHQLMDMSLEDDTISDNMLNYALSLLAMELSREYLKSSESGTDMLPPVVTSIMEWIRSNYYQPFTVSLLAEKFGYQADYLSSLFKRSTGISIVHYTNEIRIRSARTLLLNYDLTIKETAYSCGFSDEKYFMKIFKQSEGITPTQYKKAFGKKYVN